MVTPTAADPFATIQVRANGGSYAAVTSGMASANLPLNVGSNTIDVQVTSEAGTPVTTYTITVVRAAAGIEDWRVQYFGTTQNTGNAANTADPDGDATNNLLEFAFGTNPTVGQSNVVTYAGNVITPGSPTTVTVNNPPNAPSYFAEYSRRKDYASAGLTYTLQFSADLTSWVNSSDAPSVVADDGTLQVVTVPYPLFKNGNKAGFFRVVVTLP